MSESSYFELKMVEDEVYELRAEVNRLRGELSNSLKIQVTFSQENERLREALRLIAWNVDGQEPDLGECMTIAQLALDKG